jgi:hypothetical protein
VVRQAVGRLRLLASPVREAGRQAETHDPARCPPHPLREGAAYIGFLDGSAPSGSARPQAERVTLPRAASPGVSQVPCSMR